MANEQSQLKLHPTIVEALSLITDLQLDKIHCTLTGQPIATLNETVIQDALIAIHMVSPDMTADDLVGQWEEQFHLLRFITHPATTIHRLMANRNGAELVKAQSVHGLRELFCMYVMALADMPQINIPTIVARNSALRELWIMSEDYSHSPDFLQTVGGLAMLDEKYGMIDVPNSIEGIKQKLRELRPVIRTAMTGGDLITLRSALVTLFAVIRESIAKHNGQLPDATIERKRPVMQSAYLSKEIATGFTQEQSQVVRVERVLKKATSEKAAKEKASVGHIVDGKLNMNAAQKAAIAHAMKEAMRGLAARMQAQSRKGGAK